MRPEEVTVGKRVVCLGCVKHCRRTVQVVEIMAMARIKCGIQGDGRVSRIISNHSLRAVKVMGKKA